MQIHHGDCIEVMAGMDAESVHTCVTSPPYFGLRDYGSDGQIGMEPTPEEYVTKMVEVFREVRRVLADDGTLWLNLGDSYNGSSGSGGATAKQATNAGSFHDGGIRLAPGLKPKDLIGIPWRVAFALQADGWYLRQDIIWHKPNPMPESVTDRCTKAHEYIFLLSKSQRYYYNHEAIKDEAICAGHVVKAYKTGKNISGERFRDTATGSKDCMVGDKKNKRSVWTVTSKPFSGAHFATFPPDLIQPCILAGCPEGGTVLDPFMGSGTTIMVAEKNGCNGVGIELNEDYIKIARDRLADCRSLFNDVGLDN